MVKDCCRRGALNKGSIKQVGRSADMSGGGVAGGSGFSSTHYLT